MEPSSVIESVGALIYCAPTRRFLFLLRSNSSYENTWGVAGGKVELGETYLQALSREIKEEINFDSDFNPIALERFTSTNKRFLYNTFLIIVDKEFVPELNDEHDGWCWCPIDKTPEPLHPGLKKTLSFDSVMKKIKIITQDLLQTPSA